nr:MAG TPA: hypothetical protein [Caudoviricetes sp.]
MDTPFYIANFTDYFCRSLYEADIPYALPNIS